MISELDHPDQRYYASSYGRFATADQYQAIAKGANDPKNPGSWNKYAYVLGDPINGLDPRGLFVALPENGCQGDPYDAACEGDGSSAGSTSVSGDTGSDGGDASPVLTVTKFSTTSVQALIVQNDLRWLQQAINQDPTCSDWLQGSNAAINFMLDAPGSGATMMAVGVGNFSTTDNAVASTTGTNLPEGTLITVALNGAFFNAGPSNSVGYGLPSLITGNSNGAQAEILLHELAHDLGAGGFQDDGPLPNGQPNVGAQTINNGLVMKYCGGVVGLAAGRN